MVLQDGHDPAGRGERAVEGGHGRGPPVAALAHGQAAGLVGGAVGNEGLNMI